MKKTIIILTIFLSFISVHVNAKVSTNSYDDYMYRVLTPTGGSKGYVAYRIRNKGITYYSMDPYTSFSSYKDFKEKEANLPFEDLNYLSKIAIYSTELVLNQYLAYKFFGATNIYLLKENVDVTEEYELKLANINKIIAEKKFNIEDNVEALDEYKLENEYIYNNFIPESNDIEYQNHTIKFLKEGDISVTFNPKYSCDEVKIIYAEGSSDAIGFKGICERPYTVNFKASLSAIEENPSLDDNLDNDLKDTDDITKEENSNFSSVENLKESFESQEFDLKNDVKNDDLETRQTLENFIDYDDTIGNEVTINEHLDKVKTKNNKHKKDNKNQKDSFLNTNDIKVDDNITESNKKTIPEFINVDVPNTSKNSMLPFIILLIIGGVILCQKKLNI